MEKVNNYKEENGELPYESILREIEDNTLSGLIYTIHFAKQLKEYPLYYLYWEIHKKMDAIEDIMNRLIAYNVLPGWIIENPAKMLENIKYDDLILDNVETEFEINNFLDELDMEDLEDSE